MAGLEVTPEQRTFVAEPSYYLALCHYDGTWNPLAIYAGEQVVGFMMWGIDDDKSCWLGGILVDGAQQQRGYGKDAVNEAISMLGEKTGSTAFALSYSQTNTVARRLYQKLSFVETGELEDDEVVARKQMMTKHKSARQIALTEILKVRLGEVIPPDFQLIARDGVLDLTYQGMSERQIHFNFWDETSTEQENISLTVSSVLNNVQDAIAETIRERWPRSRKSAELPLPDSSWSDQTLHIWFGDRHNPALRLEPIRIGELEDGEVVVRKVVP